MSNRHITDLAASVRQRLHNLSRQRQEDFDLILGRFASERLLYRLSQSPFANQFVLKGAMLFSIWFDRPHRPTHDLDLLGYGSSTQESVVQMVAALCRLEVVADGLIFNPDSIQVEEIRAGQEYNGQRVKLMAMLGVARIPVQIDIGFGDVVSPPPAPVPYPTLLDFPAPLLRAYRRETVVAEKLHAMIVLGNQNSRMKDFFDLWTLSRLFDFEGRVLSPAIQTTFEQRQTRIPSVSPIALTAEFGQHPDKIKQWQGFLRRNRLDAGGADLPRIITALDAFLLLPLFAAGRGQALNAYWPAGGPWR